MGLACTDTGNAERMVAHFKEQLRYIPEWGAFLTWNDQHWEVDKGDLTARLFARKTAKLILTEAKVETDKKKTAVLRWGFQSQARRAIDSMIHLVKSDVKASFKTLDKNPLLLNCPNGTVDLKTGKLRKHSPEDLITKNTGVFYRPTAKAPRWDSFLKQVLPDKRVRDFLQRYIGYAATGKVTERTFVMLRGDGRNGKSVFLRMVQTALGDYATTAAPQLLMATKGEQHPTDVADLRGARLAVSSEVRKGATFDEAKIKRLTGNDRLKARFMGQDFIEFEPTHKLILAVNPKPNVRDTTDSFWDRFCLVPFEVRITRVDPDLPEKLAKELPGILAWIVRGTMEWQKQGLGRPPVIEEATKAYRADEDKLGQFFQEKVQIDAKHGFVTYTKLMAVVVDWCKARDLHAFYEKDIVDRLAALGCDRSRGGSGSLGTKARGWQGLKLL